MTAKKSVSYVMIKGKLDARRLCGLPLGDNINVHCCHYGNARMSLIGSCRSKISQPAPKLKCLITRCHIEIASKRIQVSIQGHPINAVVDTSSARTVMRRDIAESVLGLKPGTPNMIPAGDFKMDLIFRFTLTYLIRLHSRGLTAYHVSALIQANSKAANLRKELILGSRPQIKADPRIPARTLE